MNKLITQKLEMLELLYATFPDTKSSQIVTREQLLTVKSKVPTYQRYWLQGETISRGIYTIKDLSNPNIKKTTVNTKAQEMKPKEEPATTMAFTFQSSENLIPKIDTDYVPFGIYKDVEKIVKSKIFFPTYIFGASGNGKSTSVEQVCANLGRPVIRINLNNMSDEDQLIGSKTLVDGNVEIIEGPILRAMRGGFTCILDEVDAANPNTILAIQGLMEGGDFYFKLKNEVITPTKGFNIFATANTKGQGSSNGDYIGTNILNSAFLERFAITLVQDFPKVSVELKIVTNIMNRFDCYDLDFAQDLVKWADIIRRSYNDGVVDSNISTRRLIHIVKTFAVFGDKKKAVELGTNRFDENVRMSFLELFLKIKEEEVIEEEIVNEYE
jgi:MoxR-like ATPase